MLQARTIARICSPDVGREVAFAGRSNSGKSSAINTITGRNRLAFVSKTPGRTQLINFFSLGDERYLVDLPGYGYAEVPEKERRRWGEFIAAYLQERVRTARARSRSWMRAIRSRRSTSSCSTGSAPSGQAGACAPHQVGQVVPAGGDGATGDGTQRPG